MWRGVAQIFNLIKIQTSPAIHNIVTCDLDGNFSDDSVYLKGLDKCPEQCPDALSFTKHFYKPHGSEETEKVYTKASLIFI